LRTTPARGSPAAQERHAARRADEQMRVLGLHVKAGVLNYGLLDGLSGDQDSLRPVDGAPCRLSVNCGLAEAKQLSDLADRFGQDLRSMAADRVAVLATRKFSQLTYSEAWDRISRVTVIMLTCDRLGIPCQEVKTGVVGKTVGTLAKEVERVALGRVGLAAAPKYWTTGRAEAFAAAGTVLA
jgi:hypothetical protein